MKNFKTKRSKSKVYAANLPKQEEVITTVNSLPTQTNLKGYCVLKTGFK